MNCNGILRDHGHDPAEKKGQEYWYHCPFHEDDTPSFHTSEDGSIFYCFSCKKGGGPVRLIQYLENKSPQEAQVAYDRLVGNPVEIPRGRELLCSIVESLAVKGHSYFRGRGIPDEIVQRYGLGYCEDWREVIGDLDPEYLKQIGLFDLTGMAIYPYRDAYGIYKIHGRAIDQKRYITGKGEYFRQGLWGIDLVSGSEVWIFEGYHDVLVAAAHGMQSVAMAGTTMHDEYWKELWDRGIRRVIFCPDGDEGGRNFLYRLAKKFDPRFTIEIVELPSGDPDDEILAGRINQYPRKHLVEWYVGAKYKGDLTLSDKIEMYKDLSPMICTFDPAEREQIREFMRKRFGDDVAIDYLSDEPQPNPQIERVVLANMLVSQDARFCAIETLNPNDFSLRIHRMAFEMSRDEQASVDLVRNMLGIDLIGSADPDHYQKYIDDLKKSSISRKFRDILDRYRGRVNDPAKAAQEIVDRFFEISSSQIQVRPSNVVAVDFLQELKERSSRHSVGISLPERFPVLGKISHGLLPNKLIMVSGMTGHGKTMLVCNLVDGLIFEHAVKILFFSLEMSSVELMERQVTIRTGLSSTRIITGDLHNQELDQVRRVTGQMEDRLLFVDGVYEFSKILAVAKAQVARGVRVIIIDYAQLIYVGNREERWAQLARITNTLKNSICALGVTVILISQLTFQDGDDDVEIRKQAGAKAMVNDADLGLAIRSISDAKVKDGVNYTIKVGKHRYGRDGLVIPCVFDRGTLKISEIGLNQPMV